MLYGSLTPGMPSPVVEVQNPSERNVRDAASECFTVSTFMISPSRLRDDEEVATTASPKKKQKTDVESRWRSAVITMNEDKSENDNAEDDFLQAAPRKPETPRKGKGVKGRAPPEDQDSDMSTDDDEARDVLWIPPSADESLNIGEEKVFAHEKKNPSLYWPAMVQYYKKPKSAKEKPLYGIRFLDEVRAEIPRAWFFTSDQDEFATCKVLFFLLCL